MKKLKNQKGITLVALVVTIIVLLILAGVSLSLVAGSNGIMNRASNSVARNDVATSKEQAELEIMTALTAYYDAYYAGRDTTIKLGTYMADELKGDGTKLVLANKSELKTKSSNSGATATDDQVEFILRVPASNGDLYFTNTLSKDRRLGSWTDAAEADYTNFNAAP